MKRTIVRTGPVLVAAAMAGGLLATVPASAEPRGTLRTVLSGSFFPFERSFAPPSKRCQRAAAKRRAQRDDNILNSQDLVRLRRIGCGGARAW